MPATLIFNLRAATEGPVKRSFHSMMHPLFLKRLALTSPEEGEKLHNTGAMMPFSLSPVMGIRKKVRIGQSCWIRMGLLTDDIESLFLASLEDGHWRVPLSLEDHLFIVDNIIYGDDPENGWTGKESYGDLVSFAVSSEKPKMDLISPISFKRSDLHYPIPEPQLVFGNLARRWNLFSPIKLPENPVCDAVSFARYKIKTKPWALRKGGTVIGAVGQMTFILGGNEEERRYFNALLKFAFYSGIGVKTAQGMGMVRI